MYQCCTNFGFWQTAANGYSNRPAELDVKYFEGWCGDIFDTVKRPHLDFLLHFGGNNIKGSNIFFSNFYEDPWHHCGVTRDLGND